MLGIYELNLLVNTLLPMSFGIDPRITIVNTMFDTILLCDFYTIWTISTGGILINCSPNTTANVFLNLFLREYNRIGSSFGKSHFV